MVSGIELIERCRGRWYDVLVRLGISGHYLDGKPHGCPICGDGRNSHRFRFDNKNGEGTWICNQCGAGFGLQLIEQVLQYSTATAMNAIDSIVNTISTVSLPVTEQPSFDPRPALNKLWLLSNPLTGSDMVSRYMHGRGLVLAPRNVRFNTGCREPDSGNLFNAMVVRIHNVAGKPIGLHRIYLENNRKAGIPAPKKIMPATESLKGSSVRLFSSQDKMFWSGILGVAEGIETAMACSHKFQIATWACISSTLMPSWVPPVQIREVYVFGDNDGNYTGQEAAYRLGRSLHNRGLVVKVLIPNRVGDWADVWLQSAIERQRRG